MKGTLGHSVYAYVFFLSCIAFLVMYSCLSIVIISMIRTSRVGECSLGRNTCGRP